MVAGAVVVLATLAFLEFRYRYFQEKATVYRVEGLIRSAQRGHRTTEGRLFGAPYAAYSALQVASDDLGKAQLALLKFKDSDQSEILKTQVEIGARNWKDALERLTRLTDRKQDPRILNDYGVVLLQLGEQDPINYFHALDAFDRAIRLDGNLIEPLFNRMLVLRKLKFPNTMEIELSRYTSVEREGPWRTELLRPGSKSEDELAAQLEKALEHNDLKAADDLFGGAPELCRTIAMRYAINPLESASNSTVADFIADRLKRRFQDETVFAMLAPLKGKDRTDVLQIRELIGQGAADYLRGDVKSSMKAYAEAATLVAGTSSNFDNLWIDLNRVDAEIRLGDYGRARTTLDRLVYLTEQSKFRWMLGMALAAYGSTIRLNASHTDMMARLEEAIEIFDEIEAEQSAVRARYYLAGHKYFAGDLDSALRLAIDSLRLTPPTDHIRLAQTTWVVSAILYKKGLIEQAVNAGNESVLQAEKTENAAVMVLTNSSLAVLSESGSNPTLADRYLGQAQRAIQKLSVPADILRSNVNANLSAARIRLSRGTLQEAEDLLLANTRSFATEPFPFTYAVSETWMLLGRTYDRTNRVDDARSAFREAVRLAEEDGTFLQSVRLRQAYDDTRREMYDSAVDFEYIHDAPDEAWTYMQKYRAKLFLEFLAQFNPSIEKTHTIAIDRSRVQTMIPPDVQVVEYAVLPDRLLMWVVTSKDFRSRSIHAPRAKLEDTVGNFLNKIRTAQPIAEESSELFKLLFEPIQDLLDPKLALAIIPDRALHGLPFAAIKDAQSQYLIEKFRIIVSPTLTHLLATNAGKPKRDLMVAFGSQIDDTAEQREINTIKDAYRQFASFVGPEVTKTAFLDGMQRAPVVHYAGHSAHDAIDPLRSTILLDGNSYGPNSVTAVDIASHRLQPNTLVVLSSCDSSVGSSKDGIGMRGLTSAFLISGAGAVVGSLWPVEASSTADLMIRFHRTFAGEGASVADALRRAQRSLIQTFPNRAHPYYWSGFVVTGNLSALR